MTKASEIFYIKGFPHDCLKNSDVKNKKKGKVYTCRLCGKKITVTEGFDNEKRFIDSALLLNKLLKTVKEINVILIEKKREMVNKITNDYLKGGTNDTNKIKRTKKTCNHNDVS